VDGSGYSARLKAETDPAYRRIFAVVDVWDALSLRSRLSAGWPQQEVIDYLRARRYPFRSRVVSAFLDLLNSSV